MQQTSQETQGDLSPEQLEKLLSEGRQAVKDMQETGAVDSTGVAPALFNWKRHEGRTFDVDYAESGADVIYQFWPPEGCEDFPGGRTQTKMGNVPSFAMTADEVFGNFLPGDAVVVAELIDVDEQKAVARIEGTEQRLLRPHQADLTDEELSALPYRPTLYVRVEGQLSNPVGRHVLLDRIFTELDKAHWEA